MFTKTNLGGEESEQSLPSWISDHLGAKSYIDETSQSPSSPPPNSPKMDTSSLTKEGNVMTQAELDKLGSTYSFPSGIRLRIPGDGETILSARQGEVAFYEAAFQAGLRLPIHPTIREILVHYKICPAQLSPNAWRSVICSLARPDKNLFRGSPSNVKGWKTRFFFASGDEWEFPSARPPAISARKSCKQVANSEWTPRGRKRSSEDRAGGYFRGVEGTVGSRTFQNTLRLVARRSLPAAETTRPREEVSLLLGSKIQLNTWGHQTGYRKRAVRRAFPGVPDETLLMAWGEGKNPFNESPAWDLCRLELVPPPSVKKNKALKKLNDVKAPRRRRFETRSSKSPRNQMISYTECGPRTKTRRREGAGAAPAPKRFQVKNPMGDQCQEALLGGDSSPGGDVGSESMSMLLWLEAAHRGDSGFRQGGDGSRRFRRAGIGKNSKKRALKAENKLAELSEDGSKPGNEVDDLKATVAELTNKLAKAKELAIEDFKASGEFKAAVTDSAATYFSEGF
ncbi:hypothetical protein Acr_18g0006520 [Actinidia rufa]|uniref:Transposase (putative) gypsy type domain-containing protein n=1 Tax=Actinidia rufa TaxID=165716 RepID=A0A7J0G6X7_9ERIC|nr:hypothetical protein Acr_18g0006520 [Actinidia rufa]